MTKLIAELEAWKKKHYDDGSVECDKVFNEILTRARSRCEGREGMIAEIEKMKRHISYMKYVIRHKWFVWVASVRIGSSLWRALIHDWTKFLPSEWFPYAHTFYNEDGSKRYLENLDFNQAWNCHQKRNKHHWQYWLITWDRGETEPLPMTADYIKEMVADWAGAGRAITGKWEVKEWYHKNKDEMRLHPVTRGFVEALLEAYY